MISPHVETFTLEYILARPAQLGEDIDYLVLKVLFGAPSKYQANFSKYDESCSGLRVSPLSSSSS